MGRDGVVDQGLDPGLGQPRGEAVAVPLFPVLAALDHVKVPRRLGPFGDVGQGEPDAVGQRFAVKGRDPAAAVIPLIELLELDPEHRGVDRVETRIDAELLVYIAN